MFKSSLAIFFVVNRLVHLYLPSDLLKKNLWCWLFATDIGHHSTRKWGNGFLNHSSKAILKSISMQHSQQFKAFKIKYVSMSSRSDNSCNHPTVWASLTNANSLPKFQVKFSIMRVLVEQSRRNITKRHDRI